MDAPRHAACASSINKESAQKPLRRPGNMLFAKRKGSLDAIGKNVSTVSHHRSYPADRHGLCKRLEQWPQ